MPRCPTCARPVSDGDGYCPACGAALGTPTSAPTEFREGSPGPAAPTRGFTPGTMLANRYRIVAFVGRGGMGEVYRADDLRLGETVALKFLPADVAGDPDRRKRFDEEVRLARAIAHPNVCRVYDVGESDGRTFLTMEYVDGEDLVSLLRRIGRLPSQKGIEIARQLCAGLGAAHEHGVLHRDLKPANVMIDGRGHAKITDFGLAVVEGVSADAPDMAGTPAYMAPERLAGQPATVRSDLYALGLILYEVFTGKRAFEADSLAEWRKAHASSIPSRPSAHVTDVDPAAEAAMLRCLEKDPVRRPASASQLAAMLPGGDPLAAAIAAGETPSPELVAAAAREGTLPLGRAAAWLAWALAAIALFAYASSRYDGFNLLATVKDPEVLKANVQDMLGALGYPDRPSFTRWFTHWDQELAGSASLVELGSMRPSPGLFGYRESPQRLEPAHRDEGVGFDNPPPYWSGEARVATDMSGRLVDLLVLPDELETNGGGAVVADWDVPFRLAALDRAAFKEVAPRWAPFVPANERRAWAGTIGPNSVRIEGTSWQGRVGRFSVVMPTDLAPRMTVSPRSAARFAETLWIIMILVALVTVSFFARRNLRLGRADRRGAATMAVVVVSLSLAGTVLIQSWAAEAWFIWLFIIEGVGSALFGAGAIWLAYIGLEPYLRRNAPHRLIGWARLLEGRWRDPLVGRDVLFGTAIGASLAASKGLAWILGTKLGLPGLGAMTGTTLPSAPEFWSNFAYALFAAIMNTGALTAVLLLFKIILRKDLLVWTAFGILYALTTSIADSSATASVPLVIAAGLLVVTAFRSGPLCGAVALGVLWLFRLAPLATGRWYSWRSYFIVAVVVGLALYGFRVAIGRRPVFPDTVSY